MVPSDDSRLCQADITLVSTPMSTRVMPDFCMALQRGRGEEELEGYLLRPAEGWLGFFKDFS